MRNDNVLDIIICTYNYVEFLEKAINSVLSQSFKDFTLYIFDNCSDDGTEEFVKNIKDERVVYYRHDKNIGADANFRSAFDAAKKEFFIVFHDDDIMHPNLVEQEINVMLENSKVMMCSCKANEIDENDNIIRIPNTTGLVQQYSNGDYFRSYLEKCNFIMFPSAIYRTNYIHDNEIYFNSDAGPSADALIAFEIERKGGTIAIVDTILMNYRHHENQYSSKSRLEMINNLFKYLRQDPYYKDMLKDNIIGQNKFYTSMMKNNILAFLGGRISMAYLIQLKKSYEEVIENKNIDNFKYNLLIQMFKIAPNFIPQFYQASRCLIKDRRIKVGMDDKRDE